MKRLLMTLVGVLVIAGGAAYAVPGPDPQDGNPSFRIVITAEDDGVSATDETEFSEAAGWDFGDRVAYACAWVEFFRGGSEQFEVAYHAVGDYPGDRLQINDKWGQEDEDGPAPLNELCLAGSGVEQRGDFRADGSDHFPHGTALVFYKDLNGDGQVTATPGDEVARIDYDQNRCGNLYWTPGDDPAEAWLWWDGDGAADMMEHGDGLCGGGHMEPIAVVQAEARRLDPGVMACSTDDMDGDRCTTASTNSSHASRVTLRLAGGIRASGFVSVPDGTAACRQDRVVVIQRRGPTGWSDVGSDRTSEAGRYSEHIRDRDGVYRARASTATLANGDTCQADVSARRSYQG